MNDKITKLSAVAGMTLAFSTGCDEGPDPIIGEWELTRVGDVRYPHAYTDDDGCSFRASLEIEIEDDLDGEGRWLFEDSCYGNYSADLFLEVDPDGGGDYEIEVRNEEGFYFLDCELDGDEVECRDDENERWFFERK